MLVLSRKVGEQIVVNDNIVITLLEICGNKVRSAGVSERAEAVVVW